MSWWWWSPATPAGWRVVRCWNALVYQAARDTEGEEHARPLVHERGLRVLRREDRPRLLERNPGYTPAGAERLTPGPARASGLRLDRT